MTKYWLFQSGFAAVAVACCFSAAAVAEEPFSLNSSASVASRAPLAAPAMRDASLDAGAPLYPSATTAPDKKSADDWRFLIGLPLWIPGVDGQMSVDGLSFSTDQDTSDVIDLMDSHLNFALALHVEAQKGRFGFFGDMMYLNVGAERDTAIGTTTNGKIAGFIGELGLLYTLNTGEPLKPGAVPFRIDLLGGIRTTAIGVEIDPENLESRKDSKTLWDPSIGLRSEVGLAKWLSIKGRGDIGGFSAFGDDSSNLTWQASAAASFHFDSAWNLDLGYRWLSYDYDEGSGFDRFELDAVLHGPYIELDFRF